MHRPTTEATLTVFKHLVSISLRRCKHQCSMRMIYRLGLMSSFVATTFNSQSFFPNPYFIANAIDVNCLWFATKIKQLHGLLKPSRLIILHDESLHYVHFKKRHKSYADKSSHMPTFGEILSPLSW